MEISSRETQAAESVPSEYLTWEAPGAPAIRMQMDAVDALCADVIEGFNKLPRRGVEVGGILLGKREGNRVSIERFERVSCEYRFGPSYILSDQDKRAFDAALAAAAGEFSIVGFYRSHTRRELQLEPSDLEVIQRWFDDPDSVFLVVKPLDIAHLIAEFFFFEQGKLRMESAGRQFPFKGRGIAALPAAKPVVFAPAQTEPVNGAAMESRPAKGAPVVRAPIAVAAPSFTKPPKPSFFSRYWEALAATFLVLCAAGLFVWQHWGSGDSDASDQPESGTAASIPASLGLEVKPDPGMWHVTWKRDLPVIQKAKRGVLAIDDGKSHTQVPLDENQLRSGGVPYRHTSDDVTFRLEVFGEGDQTSSESFRVLLAMRSKKAAAPDPAVAPAHKVAENAPVKRPESAPASPAAPHLIPAEAVRRVQPEITEGIRSRIADQMVVMVKITIGPDGKVTHATPVNRGEGLASYLASRATEAALKWEFQPAREDDRPVASSQVIRFVFEK